MVAEPLYLAIPSFGWAAGQRQLTGQGPAQVHSASPSHPCLLPDKGCACLALASGRVFTLAPFPKGSQGCSPPPPPAGLLTGEWRGLGSFPSRCRAPFLSLEGGGIA